MHDNETIEDVRARLRDAEERIRFLELERAARRELDAWLHERLFKTEDFFEITGDMFRRLGRNQVQVHMRWRVGRFRHVVDLVGDDLQAVIRLAREQAERQPALIPDLFPEPRSHAKRSER